MIKRFIATFFAFFLSGAALAQENELLIYGYAQTYFAQRTTEYTLYQSPLTGIPFDQYFNVKNRNFTLQQANLFFQKQMNDKFMFFMNLEFTANYSSRLGSGTFGVQEAWISYRQSDLLTVKFGPMLPVFNNLSEIRNRNPLFPYVFRPVMYETMITGLFELDDYLPEQAFLQATGTLQRGEYYFDYAVHLGNSERRYLDRRPPGYEGEEGVPPQNYNLYLGEDMSLSKAVGARIGLRDRRERLKFGISATYDTDNKQTPTVGSIARFETVVLPEMGDVPRYRIGSDFSYKYGDFDFEFEGVMVRHKVPAQFAPISIDKNFLYGHVTYNIDFRTFVWANYSWMNDNSFELLLPGSADKNGLHVPSLGFGYRLNEFATLKFQHVQARLRSPYFDLDLPFTFFGLSVIF